MSTVARNNFLLGGVSEEGYLLHDHVPVLDATHHVNAGDLVYMDTSAYVAASLDSDAHAASLLGVAMQSSLINSNLDNSASAGEPSIQVGYGGIWNFNTTSGDTYHDGDALYIGADAQTVTNTAGMMTHKVGCVRLPINVSSVAGGSGIQVPVFVYSKYYVTFGN